MAYVTSRRDRPLRVVIQQIPPPPPPEKGFIRRILSLVVASVGATAAAVLTAFGLALALIYLTAGGAPTITLEGITAKENLAKDGFSSEVLSRIFQDEVASVRALSLSDRPNTTFVLKGAEYSFEVPTTKIPFDMIVSRMRELVGRPAATVRGQISEAGEGIFRLKLWTNLTPEGTTVEGKAGTLNQAMQSSALALLAEIDPYVVTNYYLFRDRPDLDAARRMIWRMEALAKQRTSTDPNIIRRTKLLGQPPDEHWLQLVWGYLLKAEGYRFQAHGLSLAGQGNKKEAEDHLQLAEMRFKDALRRFESADRAFAKFTSKSKGWELAKDGAAIVTGSEGLAGLLLERVRKGLVADDENSRRLIADYAKQARGYLEPIISSSGTDTAYAGAYKTRAVIANMLEGRPCDAYPDILASIDVDPRNAPMHGDAGDIIMEQIRRVRYEPASLEHCHHFPKDLSTLENLAKHHYERALAFKSDYVPALVQWGTLLAQRCEFDDATVLLTRAAGIDAHSSEIQAQLAKIKTSQLPGSADRAMCRSIATSPVGDVSPARSQ